MKLPKKITPERIREAIVQLHFSSAVPFEPLIGYLYAALSEVGYAYTNRPETPRHFLPQGTQVIPSSFDVVFVPQYFFFNEYIRVQVRNDGSLTFNCLDTYPGWTTYFGEIKKVVSCLIEKEIGLKFHRIGFRYISEFPNTDILESTHFSVSLSGLGDPISSGNFRVELAEDPYRVIINLAANLPIAPLVVQLDEEVKFTSLIDIDVIHQGLNESDAKQLFSQIDAVHLKEKEWFFRLLKEEFLKTLNPEYDTI